MSEPLQNCLCVLALMWTAVGFVHIVAKWQEMTELRDDAPIERDDDDKGEDEDRAASDDTDPADWWKQDGKRRGKQ